MIVTLDTNILYQALNSQNGASFYIFKLIRAGHIRLALSNSAFCEYEDVLTRPSSLKSFELTKEDVIKFLRYIAFIDEKFEPHFLFRPNLKDEADNMFVELAVVSHSQYLVTSNMKDYQHSNLILDNFQLVTPANFAKQWREKHG